MTINHTLTAPARSAAPRQSRQGMPGELLNPLLILRDGIALMADETDDQRALKKIFESQVQEMFRAVSQTVS